MFSTIRGIMNGPRLFKLFKLNENGRKILLRDYEMNSYERIGETIISSMSYALIITYYCSPVVAYHLYSKNILTDPLQLRYYIKLCTTICATYAIAHVIRWYGRSSNNDYAKFMNVLKTAIENRNGREGLQQYDFEFRSWPVDFHWNESSLTPTKNPNPYEENENGKSRSQAEKMISYTSGLLEWFLAYGLARPMAYPGSVKLLQNAMAPALLQGRMGLYQKGGLRAKLLTQDGNEIDTMYLDRRSDSMTANGNTLVICCEGNAAFYEAGSIGTPLNGNYSVLGWNHPGFMGSTGVPSPTSERNAIDAVMNYAVSRLGFDIKDVILFAWSIGGYPATYAAMKYPNIKALILDATFDNIKALAVMRMPSFASGLVTNVIDKYMNLNNADHLKRFPGPIRIIRRQQEEIITTEPNVPATNRGNYLLKKLFVYRYPNLYCKESLQTLDRYLAATSRHEQEEILKEVDIMDEETFEIKLTLSEDNFQNYPLDIGKEWSSEEKVKALLYLATKYMDHFDATHCVALPISYFKLPWQHKIRSK